MVRLTFLKQSLKKDYKNLVADSVSVLQETKGRHLQRQLNICRLISCFKGEEFVQKARAKGFNDKDFLYFMYDVLDKLIKNEPLVANTVRKIKKQAPEYQETECRFALANVILLREALYQRLSDIFVQQQRAKSR